MRIAKIMCICIVVLQLCGVSFLVNETSADGSEPWISSVHHTPKYPLYGDGVTVYANVTDPDGIQSVKIYYCSGETCYSPISMTDPDSDGIYSGTILWNLAWGVGTVIDYDIWAEDMLSNTNNTEKYHYLFVSEIELDTETEQDIVYVRDTILLSGTALYNGNATAPVEYSEVTVEIADAGLEYDTTTDIDGKFTLELGPFDDPGDYTINTTVTNRTLVGKDELNITVKPLIIFYFSEFLQFTTCYPGDEIWVNGTAGYNSGKPVVYSDVEVRINETLFWAGVTNGVGNYSVLITAPNETGQYEVNVTVVNGSLVAYNETPILVTEVPLPDLTVDTEDIDFVSENKPPLKDDEVNIRVFVHNRGSADAADVTVSFYIGSTSEDDLLGTDTLSSISVGGTATASIIWKVSNGTHYIWVVVESSNTILESFEDNNNASRAIFVDNDFDGDGIGDMADKNDDNDAYLDEDDAFPHDPTEWLDSDGDNIGNNADKDDDNDGLSDEDELKKGTDPLNPDTDGDGVNDKKDRYPLDPDKWKEELPLLFILIPVIGIIVILVVVFIFIRMRKSHRTLDTRPEEVPTAPQTKKDLPPPPPN